MTARRNRAREPARRTAVPAETRDAVHLRDDFACVYCRASGAVRRGVVITVDHVVPAHFGGRDDASNLVTACSVCNWMKGIYPLDLWLQLAERLGYGSAASIEARVRAALAKPLPRTRARKRPRAPKR